MRIDTRRSRITTVTGGTADPAVVLKAARNAGYEPVGAPRRKPKHFEVLGRRDGTFTELHIELDGHIRKTKPAAGDEPKWTESTLAHLLVLFQTASLGSLMNLSELPARGPEDVPHLVA